MIKSKSLRFAVEALRRNPARTYESVAKAARARRLRMWPIVYGRAVKYLAELNG